MYKHDSAYGTAQDKIERIRQTADIMSNSQFHVVYMPKFTLQDIITVTREYHLKYGIVALFFDYINLTSTLMAEHKGMRDYIILTTFTEGLKTLGGTLNIPVFTASQENRTGYGSTEKDAKNIGGSIGILQKATKLLFLRNMTDEEIVLNRNSNQKMLIKYLRHGESGQEINLYYDRIRITQREV
jgi:replicative DNA helicase